MDFPAAREAVRNGMAASDAARRVVAALTPEERLWCLDGDAPTWAGLGFLGDNGYHLDTFTAARIERVGLPGVHFADGPRDAWSATRRRSRCRWLGGHLGPRARGACRRGHRARAARRRRRPHRGGVRQPAPPPRLGPGPGDLRRGPPPRGRAGRGAHAGPAAPRHGVRQALRCNSMENARFSVDIEVDEVALHEVYLPHFRRIVDEGVAAVMTAYNSVNGEWCGQSNALIADVLRGEWGFEGFVISDWIFGLRDGATSVAAGLDIEMPYRMVRSETSRQRSSPARSPGTTSMRRRSPASSPRCCASTPCSRHLLPPRDAARRTRAPRAGPRGRRALGGAVAQRLGRRLARAAARSRRHCRGGRAAGRSGQPRRRGLQRRVGPRLRHRARRLRRRLRIGPPRRRRRPRTRRPDRREADAAVVVVGYTYLDEGEYIGATAADARSALPCRRRARRRRALRRPHRRPAAHRPAGPGGSERPADSASAATGAACVCTTTTWL
jgi:hypothetical protein